MRGPAGTIACALLLLAAGCGGDDHSSSSTQGSAGSTAAASPALDPAQQEVVRKANAICGEAAAKSKRALDGLARAAGGVERIRADSTVLPVLIQGDVLVTSQALKAHRKLRAPENRRADYEQFVASEGRLVAALEEAREAIKRGPEALARVGPKIEAAGVAASRAAGRYGLTGCPAMGPFISFITQAGGAAGR